MITVILEMSLKNKELYEGCHIRKIGKKLHLATPMMDAVPIISNNTKTIFHRLDLVKGDEVCLTGAMTTWAYLTVFSVARLYELKVIYHDGREDVVIP